jgi:integrase
MRIESTAGNEHKVWLTDPEIEDLRRATNSQRDDIIIQLGAFVGLRAFEMPQVRPVDVKETESGQYRLRVEAGKDTSGNGGKPRDAFLPDSVERDLQRYQNEHNIAPKDPFIDLKQPGVRAVVRRTAARAADETGDDDFRKVSTHDLRRRFAQRLLVDEQMNPRVVMAVGGWDSFAAIEPYLNAPSEDVIDDAFGEVELQTG